MLSLGHFPGATLHPSRELKWCMWWWWWCVCVGGWVCMWVGAHSMFGLWLVVSLRMAVWPYFLHIGDHPDGAFWTTLSCSTAQFYPNLWPSRGSVAHYWPWLQRAHSLMAFNVTLLISVLEIHSTFNSKCNVLRMPILMSVSKSTQVLSKFCFPWWHTWARSKGLRTIGSQWPDQRDKTELAVWPGVGEKFLRGQLPQDNSVSSGWFE